jgi:hypothetical protein
MIIPSCQVCKVPQGPLLLIRDAKRQCQVQDHLQLDPSLDLRHLILDLRLGQDREALRGVHSLLTFC